MSDDNRPGHKRSAEEDAAQLRTWASGNAKRQTETAATLSSSETDRALSPRLVRGRGTRTPLVDFRHAGHASGLKIGFRRAGDTYVPEVRAPAASIWHAGSDHPYGGSTRLTCVGCGHRIVRSERDLIRLAIRALERGAPESRGYSVAL